MFNAENDFIAISTLNDFIFCPYSIYLTMCLMEQMKTCSMPCHKSKGKRLIHQLIPKATVWDVGL